MSKLSDLQKRRKQLVKSAVDAFAELEKVDAQIMTLIDRARDALLGEDPYVEQQHFSPKRRLKTGPHFNPFINANATFHMKAKKVREPSLQAPIIDVLSTHKGPLTQDELLHGLHIRGVKVNGKKPKSTLSAHVSYLIKKNVLARIGDRIALKQHELPGIKNENATKAH